MKISARALQELLSGRLSQEEFFRIHRFGDFEGKPWNPFDNALKQGRLIDHVVVEKCATGDDDWITFYFSAKDPAIASFRVPDTPPKEGPTEPDPDSNEGTGKVTP
jgi:hypothetical protein